MSMAPTTAGIAYIDVIPADGDDRAFRRPTGGFEFVND